MESISTKISAALKALFYKGSDGKNAIRLVEVAPGSPMVGVANSQSARSFEQFLLSAIELVGGKPALRFFIEKKYKVYTVLVSQAGTAAQTVKVLENTLGAVTLAYEGVGIFQFNTAALFTANKTVVIAGQGNTPLALVRPEITSTSRITLCTFLSSEIANALTATATNTLLTDTVFEIRVYS